MSAQKKNIFYSWRVLLASIGLMSFYILPLLPVFETSAITPQTLRWSVLVAGLLMVLLLTICVKYTPSTNQDLSLLNSNNFIMNVRKETASQLWLSIQKNPPLIIFFLSFVFYVMTLFNHHFCSKTVPYQWWGAVKQCFIREIWTHVSLMFWKTTDFQDFRQHWFRGTWIHSFYNKYEFYIFRGPQMAGNKKMRTRT